MTILDRLAEHARERIAQAKKKGLRQRYAGKHCRSQRGISLLRKLCPGGSWRLSASAKELRLPGG